MSVDTNLIYQMMQRDFIYGVANYVSTPYVLVNMVILSMITYYVTKWFTKISDWIKKIKMLMVSSFNHVANLKKTSITMTIKTLDNNVDQKDWENIVRQDLVDAICDHINNSNISMCSYDSDIHGIWGERDRLKSTKITHIPSEEVKIADDIWFLCEKRQYDNQHTKRGVPGYMKITLSSSRSLQHINEFIEKIKTEFVSKIKKPKERSAFCRHDNLWEKYTIKKNRTFNSLFFNGKEKFS